MRLRFFAGATALSLAAALVGAAPAEAVNPTLHFSKAYVNSPGTDTGTNYSINSEYVVISNSSYTASFTLTGYTVSDRSAHVYRFRTFVLKPRASVTLHSGIGTNTSTHLYWGSRAYIWNNTGDAAYLRWPGGTAADSCSWGRTGSSKYC